MAYPFFCSAVVSAWLCFFSVFPHFEAQTGASFRKFAAAIPVQAGNPRIESPPVASPAAVPAAEFPVPAFNHHSRRQGDAILSAYRNEVQQQWVVAFFAGVLKPAGFLAGTSSAEAAAAILANASAFDISPSLAFALCWVESQFNPTAINKTNRNGSIDRGLFQLNNLSFPKLKETDFFNPSVNAYYGMAHLRWCLDAGGSTVAGLAMYNAGTGRINAEGAPKRTLDYISRILEFQQKIEDTFASYPLPMPVTKELAAEPANDSGIPEPGRTEPYFGKPRLTLLSPIAGRL
ncbi:MAG: lytic transglycosylase domain-containing protein [Treponema sp.]|nr:lytic transglycosylase domain-containing protein [Treponema sp.]